jgi:hypothetical protein
MAAKNVTFACFDMYKAFEQRDRYFSPPENRLLNMDLPGLNRSCILEKRYTPTHHEKDPLIIGCSGHRPGPTETASRTTATTPPLYVHREVPSFVSPNG